MDCVETPTLRPDTVDTGSPHLLRAVLVSDALRLMTPIKVMAVLAGACTLLAGCAQQQQSGQQRTRSKEYFSSDKYGPASARVVGEGQAVPRGGGQYLVGRPYTIAGRRYFPSEQPKQTQSGTASYYGSAFHGRRTANGEVYDMTSITAAHPTMPLPSYARVTNTTNGRSIIVRVNDRGPFHSNRVMDVSQRVADALDFRRMGTAQVKIDYISRAGLEGSDDRRLLASLRTDGRPATLDGAPSLGLGTMFASNDPEPAPVVAVPRIAPTPAPTPAPTAAPAQRLALFSEPAAAETSPVVAARAAQTSPVYAPLPPVRPFDLGTVPGADVQIGTSRPASQPSREINSTLAQRQAPPSAGRPLALVPPSRPAFVDAELPPRR